MVSLAKNYSRLLKEFKTAPLVFYSEGRHHSQHLFPIVKEILKKKKVLYVTSDDSDPILHYPHHNLDVLNIGLGIYRTLFFQNVSCKVFVTSLPDLNTFHLKTSKSTEYYIYIHHSIVSCHMAYREGAFDAFDEVFCVGPHHIKELSIQENIFNTPKKVLTPHGNAKIDALTHYRDYKTIPNTILIAPSWGENGLFEKHLSYLIDVCKNNTNFLFILRPHSETIRKVATIEEKIKSLGMPNIIFDDGSENSWLYKSELMISDWSGVAYEFSLGLNKPVIFLDINTKINNPNYTELKVDPFEVCQREAFGCVVNLTDLDHLPSIVAVAREKKMNLSKESEKLIYNLGNSNMVAAQTIYERIGYTNKESLEALKSNYKDYTPHTPYSDNSINYTIKIMSEEIESGDFSIDFLRILTKKIDVTKEILDFYDNCWKKTPTSQKLHKEEILICCYYLFLCLEHFEKENNKYLILKISNSLLNLCKLNAEVKEEYLDFFQEQIKRII